MDVILSFYPHASSFSSQLRLAAINSSDHKYNFHTPPLSSFISQEQCTISFMTTAILTEEKGCRQ